MKAVLLLVAVAGALFGLHKLALWMESRGWIYYVHHKTSPSTLGNAFLEVQSLLDPSAEALVELKDQEHYEDDASGEPPEPGVLPPADNEEDAAKPLDSREESVGRP